MKSNIYKKTYNRLFIFAFILLMFLFIFLLYYISKESFFLIFAALMFFSLFFVMFYGLFIAKNIYYIENNNDEIIIKYKNGKNKKELYLKKNEIEKLLFTFKIKARSGTRHFYNYISMKIHIELKNKTSVTLEDEYVLNGLNLFGGSKNLKQIDSVRHIVNMFKYFDRFSYNIINTHAIYDKRYQPEAIKSSIEN